jgi:LacI family transcriptional regulator
VRHLSAAAQLGYSPDRLGSGLRLQRHGVVRPVRDRIATTPANLDVDSGGKVQ